LADIYDEAAYKQFAERFSTLLKGENIRSVKLEDLREPSLRLGTRSTNGSYGWRSFTSSRIGPKTVYLGSPGVRLPRPSDVHKALIASAPQELENVLHLMQTLPFVHLRRQMGRNGEYNPICNLYVSVADPKNHRIAYMWGNTLRDPGSEPGP